MDIQLSQREKEILLHLLYIQEWTTSKTLSKKFNISIRTVKYDIANIKEWLKFQGYILETKRGQGVCVDISKKERKKIIDLVLQSTETDIGINPQLRQMRIIVLLLEASNDITSEDLSNEIYVSKKTILNDIDVIEEELLGSNLKLCRKNGKGFSIQGNELDKRLLLERIFHNEISEYDLYQILRKVTDNDTKLDIYAKIGYEYQKTSEKVIGILNGILQTGSYSSLSDNDILSLITRTTISINRLKQCCNIGDFKLLDIEKNMEIYNRLSYVFISKVFTAYDLPLFMNEFNYINSILKPSEDKLDIKTITQTIINQVSEKMGFPFNKDRVLFTNLFAHLSLRLSKGNIFVNEFNPFTFDIKRKYPNLVNVLKKVCEDVLCTVDVGISDSSVVYIALHFLVAYDSYEEKRNLKVLYVCSTGVGVTSLIHNKINEYFNDLEIVDFSSVLEVNDKIEMNSPDIIISIFPLNDVSVPVIKVNPLPTSEDIHNIKTIKEEILKNNELQVSRIEAVKDEIINIPPDNTQEIMGIAFIVYQKLVKIFNPYMSQMLKDSFLLHVFLMVNRICSNKQYHSMFLPNKISDIEQNIILEIKKIMKDNKLLIDESEIEALLQYIRY
ncbi:transcriptional antiterminator, BglG family [Granulicatella balaenopterae]|uniref:Transcriptional antiterminator, BglG family n=1 Tax=Granulicatella balaenopterae TaxID=137733 RepID=A0A1H9NW91_9LACT|nr:PRD domain-containing protein [Granulicatella balaenopterae]SER40067.1 transcriptional antiterminator, BglG family [Granulicatella balaenopterae]